MEFALTNLLERDPNDSFIFHSVISLIGNSDVKRTVLFNRQESHGGENPPKGGVGYQKSGRVAPHCGQTKYYCLFPPFFFEMGDIGLA